MSINNVSGAIRNAPRLKTIIYHMVCSLVAVATIVLVVKFLCYIALFNYCDRNQIRYPFEGMPYFWYFTGMYTLFSYLVFVLVFYAVSFFLNGVSKSLFKTPLPFSRRRAVISLMAAMGFVIFLAFTHEGVSFWKSLPVFILLASAITMQRFRPVVASVFGAVCSLSFAAVALFADRDFDRYLQACKYGGGISISVMVENSASLPGVTVDGELLLRSNEWLTVNRDDVVVEFPLSKVKFIGYRNQ